MKTLLFFLTILTFSVSTAYSQGNYEFLYDADGNMTTRRLAVQRISRVAAEAPQDDPVDDNTDFLQDRKITIYPNPTRGRITLSVSPLDATIESTYALYDSSGRLLDTNRIDSETTGIEITGTPGIYLLDVKIGDEVSQWKIIKQ
ncbi:MAG: T9SS type A sorting domain-containing protein [Bacteroidales bacterium]|nr:T9SS type A sorting domain-containing protein [Bacteroidales bacterium]